jgi:hypothetical protein
MAANADLSDLAILEHTYQAPVPECYRVAPHNSTNSSSLIQDIYILTTDAIDPGVLPMWAVKAPASAKGISQVNFYDKPDDNTRNHWLNTIGAYLGRYLMAHQGKQPRIHAYIFEPNTIADVSISNSTQCRLAEFPGSYELRVHKKGDKGNARKDAYLRGV